MPRERARLAIAALSDDGLALAAAHAGVASDGTRAELVERIVARKILPGFAHHLELADLRAVVAALGLEVPAASNERDLRALLFAHDRTYSPAELQRRASLERIGPTSMTAERLAAEGRALAARALHLSPTPPLPNARPAATWQGEDEVVIRVDLSVHPDAAVRRDAILEVRSDPSASTAAVMVTAGGLGAGGEATPLYGVEADDVPSIDVVFARGTEAVGRWLAENRWSREVPWNANFTDAEPVRAYQRAWFAAHPFGATGTWAQLGGWPLPWPDEAVGPQLSRTLVLRTYRGAEPWIEVWLDRAGFRATLRIT